ncbi:MAG TPA: MATE family efflux transporter, partial [Vicinamibacterales bacterium]|nr:MATE family efflux transporter [Vicinamibacterales bacterium]
FKTAAMMATGVMLIVIAIMHIAPGALVRIFSSDPNVIAVGEVYLRIASWNFVASGLIFVSSSMFQAIGNTMPSLATSFTRIVLIAVPLLYLSGTPGFKLEWIWWISVASVGLQMVMNLLLLRREFDRRLQFDDRPIAAAPPVAAAAEL